jgi:hypothetical protein
MPIIQATPNLKLEKPEANHAAWERAYWRLATLVDLWLTQIARGHYVLSGGHLTLTAGHIDLDATSVQFVGTAASFALGAQTAIAALVADDTYVVYVDNAGALQVSTLTPALLWSGALPSNFVLLGAVFEVEGVWTIHNRPLATGRGALGGIAGLNGAGHVPDAQLAAVIHGMDFTGAGGAAQQLYPGGWVYNLYYDGGWKYFGNGFGFALNVDTGTGRIVVSLAPNNAGGAGAAAAPVTLGTFEQDGKFHASQDAANIVSGTFAQARIGAAAVGQGQLKTSTGFVSVYNTSNNLILAGGQYGFYPYLSRDATGTGGESRHLNIGNASFTDVTYIYLSNGGANLYASQRYIQASPPYDLGDGEIPLFVFALVEADGRISSVYTAPDPPWANNGPTNIRPDCWIGGKSHQARCIVLPKPAPDAPANAWEAWADSMAAQPTHELIEVTQAIKQADMPLIPHPFLGNDLSGRTVVLLDPVSPLTERLLLLHEAGESINALLHEDYLRVDNSAILRKAPPGVISCAARWKNSK